MFTRHLRLGGCFALTLTLLGCYGPRRKVKTQPIDVDGAAETDNVRDGGGTGGKSGTGGATGTGGARPLDAAPGGTGGAGETGGSGGDNADAAAEPDLPPEPEPDAGVDAANADAPPSTPPEAVLPVPSAAQLEWQRLGLTAFFHFGMNTFTNDEVGDGNASPDTFDPAALDTGQWISTVKNAGFKQGILVAKHHDGFVLWQTKCSDYSVAKSAWKGGQGDVVKDFTEAAHQADFRVGLYLSPLDNHPADSSGAADYGDKFRCWVDELLTNYGRIDEIWFDGNGAPAAVGRDLYEHIKQLQPHILIFAGPEIAAPGVDIRWVGNEGGYAPAGETNVHEMGNDTIWYPSECDTSIRPGWFYHPEDDGAVKSLAQLTDTFFSSVGRNSTLLLNIPPNKDGLLAAQDVARLGQFGASIRNLFTTNRAAGKPGTSDSTFHPDYGPSRALDGNLDTFWAAGDGSTSGRLEVDLGGATSVRIVDLREPIALGERSKKYHVEIQAPGESTWTTIGEGTVIGHRQLLRVNPARMAEKLAVVIEEARGVPAIAELGVY